ncbi:UMP kinase [Patescibacteria group bacterium]|nr:UMP kinase [Patescibacteria group bacterium]
MSKNQYKIISVGGSIIIPKTGFDINFLKKFKALILKQVKKGDKFILVIGGGATCRVYQDALGKAVKTNNTDLDWMGIHTTIFNAQFVRLLFKDVAYAEVVIDPTKKIKTNKSVLVASGWKPGCSSDKDAVLLAQTYGAKEVINLSNIEYVYDKDPNKYKTAKKIEEINWKDFRKNVVGYKWVPGKNVPFDPIASGLAEKLGLRVSILKGTDLGEVEKVIGGGKFKGTVITPLSFRLLR